MACSVRFKYPARGSRPPVDLCWYDGGMRPKVPDALIEDGTELEPEGMMFVGDTGKILAGFLVENPRLIPKNRMVGVETALADKKSDKRSGFLNFLDACRNGKQCAGNFSEARALTEAVNLYAASLRAGQLLKYDGSKMEITNNLDANKYLSRTYRAGWNPDSI